MKIVFLAPFGIRPKGTVIARMLPLAVELQKLAHKVVIVAPPYTNPEDSGKVERLNGVKLVNVVLPNCGKVGGALLIAWRMFLAFRDERPALVHLYKPKGYGGLVAMLLICLRQMGVRLPPLFVDSDDWEGSGGMNEIQDYSWFEKRFFAFQEQWLLRQATGVTVASRTLEECTHKIGVPLEHILYLPNCVEATPSGDGANVRKRHGIDANAPVMLLYTRFFEFSQEKLHRLFADIYSRIPQVRFLVVGKGRCGEETQLEIAAEHFGFQKALAIAGWVEPNELSDYLAAADVAVYPMDDTLVNRAKCPAKLTEILCAGIPVVADRVGQSEEYIHEGVSGFLSDPANMKDMADKTVSLLLDMTKSKLMGAEGRRYLISQFNWHDFARKLESFYVASGTSVKN